MVINVLKKRRTMKKTYINPMTLVITIKASKLLTGSEYINKTDDYGDGSGVTLGARRRGSSFYDDEDDDW